MTKKHRTVNSQFSNRKKRHLRLIAVRFFPFTHCQKIFKLLFPSSKNAAICAYTDNSEKLLSGILPIRFSSVHCQKSAIYSYLSYKNAATSSYLFANRKKRHLSATLPCCFSLYALSKIILYTQFQNLIYSLPQQLGLHTVPIIGENLQSIFLLNFSSKSIFHLFSTLSQQLWVGW